MMENRSFDNLLGWLYDNETDAPAFNIEAKTIATYGDALIHLHPDAP
jgi:phospholipase C